jgi:hypothetical protein
MTAWTMPSADARAMARAGGWQPPIGVTDASQIDQSARSYVAFLQNRWAQLVATGGSGQAISLANVPITAQNFVRASCLPSTLNWLAQQPADLPTAPYPGLLNSWG